MTTRFITVAKTEEIAPGSCRSVELQERSLALFNLDGTIYALDNTCPHAGGPLGEGTIEGQLVACPWHGWKFDIPTGTCMKNPIDSWRVKRYEVRESDGQIQVLLPATEQHNS
ncbi:MAG: nitrite reductase small subunit NirD [Nitrospirales bacterium]|nr:nitrite reductase small subunit NirD [Nitrospira sp.]MDR4502249.1 nitrite reductase small subunit NirD [Nitrospirales bacterium]